MFAIVLQREKNLSKPTVFLVAHFKSGLENDGSVDADSLFTLGIFCGAVDEDSKLSELDAQWTKKSFMDLLPLALSSNLLADIPRNVTGVSLKKYGIF